MPRRIELEGERARATLLPVLTDPLALQQIDGDPEVPSLPRDLPPWARDAVAVSHRARDLIAKLKPVVVRVLTFWDHRARSVTIEGRRLNVDTSGSYRLQT